MRKRIAILMSICMLAGVCAFAESVSDEREAARAAFLAEVRLEEADVLWSKVAYDDEKGGRYELKLIYDGREYEGEVRASDAVVLEWESEPFYGDEQLLRQASVAEADEDFVGLNAALEALYEFAGITGETAEHAAAWADYDDGTLVYEARCYVGAVEYEIEMDARTGALREADADRD